MFFYIKQHKHIALHQIMFFLATSYEPFKKEKCIIVLTSHLIYYGESINSNLSNCLKLVWICDPLLFPFAIIRHCFPPYGGLVEKMHLLMIFCFHAQIITACLRWTSSGRQGFHVKCPCRTHTPGLHGAPPGPAAGCPVPPQRQKAARLHCWSGGRCHRAQCTGRSLLSPSWHTAIQGYMWPHKWNLWRKTMTHFQNKSHKTLYFHIH